MAKKDRSNFSFAGKVIANAEKIKRDQSFSYMILPKDTAVYSPDPGTVKFDIIPYIVTSDNHPDRDDDLQIALPGDAWYKRPFFVHRNVGIDSETVFCLQSVGEKCPICEHYASMKAKGAAETEQGKKDLDAIRQKARNLYWLVPLGARKWDEDLHLMDISHFLFQDLLLDELKEQRDHENFSHPIEGKSLSVRWSKNSFDGRSFAKAERVDFKLRDHEYDWDLVEELPSLDKLIEENVLSYNKLQQLFMSVIDDEEPDEDELQNVPDEELQGGSGRKRKSPLSRKTKSAEAEDEDGSEEEAPARVKKTLGRTRKSEEEEEKPATRKRTVKSKTRKTYGDDTENECPFGHEFGVDTDNFPDCEDCTVWEACNDARKKND